MTCHGKGREENGEPKETEGKREKVGVGWSLSFSPIQSYNGSIEEDSREDMEEIRSDLAFQVVGFGWGFATFATPPC